MSTTIAYSKYLNMILKKTYLHYEVRLDQLSGSSNFILIFFSKAIFKHCWQQDQYWWLYKVTYIATNACFENS